MMMKLIGPTDATQGSLIIAIAINHQWDTPMWITFRVAFGGIIFLFARSVAAPINPKTNAYEAMIPRAFSIRGTLRRVYSCRAMRGYACRRR